MKGHCAVSSTGNADAHIASRYAGGYLRKVLTPHACHDRCPNTLLSQKRNQALSYPRRDIGAIFRTWSTSKHSEFRCAPLCAGDQIGRFPETLQNPVAGALIQRAQGTRNDLGSHCRHPQPRLHRQSEYSAASVRPHIVKFP